MTTEYFRGGNREVSLENNATVLVNLKYVKLWLHTN